jgi:pantothenate kinase-related protein Tda10
LLQHRGVPSTHDIETGVELFEALANRTPDIKVPSYDKSRFNGAGDRRPEAEWPVANKSGQSPVDVIIFEGWCVGFRALSDEEVEKKWRAAKAEAEDGDGSYQGRLGKLQLEHVLFVNGKLREYDGLTDKFGAFIHMCGIPYMIRSSSLHRKPMLTFATVTRKIRFMCTNGARSKKLRCVDPRVPV